MRRPLLLPAVFLLGVGGYAEAEQAAPVAPPAAPEPAANDPQGEPPAPAGEQPEPLPAEAGQSESKPEPETGPKADEPKADEPKPLQEFDLKGRVFVRNVLLREGWSNQLEINSTRLGVAYRDRANGLRAEVEVEFGDGDADLRDAYVRMEVAQHIDVQAGRFKRPISAVSLASRWDLPVTDRGLLDDLQVFNANTREPDELPLGARVTGAQARFRDKKLPAKPALIIGVFRSAVHEQIAETLEADRSPIGLTEGFPEDIIGRLEIEPIQGMVVGASLGWMGQLSVAGRRDDFEHDFVAGLDVVLEQGPLRLWLEGFLGESPLHLPGAPAASGLFVAARGIVAARLPLQSVYIEPYITAQGTDGSSDHDEDGFIQAGGGVNLGLGEAWRVQFAVDHVSTGELLDDADTGTRFIVQLGAVF